MSNRSAAKPPSSTAQALSPERRTKGAGVEHAAEGRAAGPGVHQLLLARVPDVQQLLQTHERPVLHVG